MIRKTMNNSKHQTPTEKLRIEKCRVSRLLKEQEATINAHVSYVQDNAGRLFLSFISSMLFNPSSGKSGQLKTVDTEKRGSKTASEPLSFADFVPLTKLMIPIAWDIAKPVLLSWGIKKAGTLLSGIFTRKKALPNN